MQKSCRAACWCVSMSMSERSMRCLWTTEQAARSMHVVVRLREGATPWAPLAGELAPADLCWREGCRGTLLGWGWDMITSQQPAPGRNLALKSNYICRLNSFVLLSGCGSVNMKSCMCSLSFLPRILVGLNFLFNGCV